MKLSGVGKNSLQLIPLPSPTPSAKPNQSDFDKAMARLDSDITNADPTVNDLPYPPVNAQLYVIQNNQ
jgi:hypothetical protein